MALQVIHSSYLGERLSDLHDNEIDFKSDTTDMIGAVLHGYERNISWYLMRTQSLPENCIHSPECQASMVTTNGYVNFSNRNIRPNIIYYICAHAEEMINRDASGESLTEIYACSDGFVIDNVPPYGGQVTVVNTNGYINNRNDLYVSWNGFEDNIDVNILGYTHSIASYTVHLGENTLLINNHSKDNSYSYIITIIQSYHIILSTLIFQFHY